MKRTILAIVGTAILCVAAVAQQSGQPGRPMQAKSESGAAMKDFVASIENMTDENSNFRRVLCTGKNLQLVLMALKPGEEIASTDLKELDGAFFNCEVAKASDTASCILNGALVQLLPEDTHAGFSKWRCHQTSRKDCSQ